MSSQFLSMQKVLIVLFLLLSMATSCKRQTIPFSNVKLGKDYVKIETGHFIDYELDSIIYDDFNLKTDTFRSIIRDEVGATFLDNQNRESFLIKRKVKDVINNAWIEQSDYYVTLTESAYEVVDNNLRFIKLIFPVKESIKWDGNAYLPTALNPELQWYDGWSYQYLNVNNVWSNQALSFPNTVIIKQADFNEGNASDPLAYSAKTFSQEIYAKNVGMVHKEITRWVYQPSVVKYKKGFTLIFNAINHN
ncbi:MAG: hypothetical protein R2831_11220 [Chitinophagaceae bacterium]